MLLFLMLVASLNLVLGMITAVIVSPEPRLLHALCARLPLPILLRLLPPLEPEVDPAAHESPESGPAASESIGSGLDIPEEWSTMLAAHGLRPRTLWEAVVCCLQIRLLAHLPALTTCERKLRSASSPDQRSAAAEVLERLAEEQGAWVTWLKATVAWMSTRRAIMGVTEEQESVLEEKLQERVHQGDVVLKLLSGSSPAASAPVSEILLELNRDLYGTHALRDLTLESLAQVFASEQRWPELSLDWLYDPHTGLRNRLGFKTVVHEWLQADPQRMRLMSILFVECDRLGKWNERLGTAGGDDLFRAFAQRIGSTIRNDRGDRAVRFSGSTIAVLLADAGAAGGRCAAERIRQTITSTLFQMGSEELALAANCAVTEYFLDDTLPEVVRRLQEGIKEAKKAGRNRTAIDEGSGPKVFEAIPMSIPGKTIPVEPLTDAAATTSGE